MSFEINEKGNGKLISLSKPLDTRAKILDFSYAILFIIATLGFMALFLLDGSIFGFIGTIVFGICFYRFAKRAAESEQLYIDKEKFEIIRKNFLKKSVLYFELSEISHFKFHERPKFSPHPLKGETFDYLGFQTEQQVISDVHTEGRISFMYKGKEIKFGKDLYSWNFEELEMLLYDVTGNDFRYRDADESKISSS